MLRTLKLLGIAIVLSIPAVLSAQAQGEPEFGRFFIDHKTRMELDHARDTWQPSTQAETEDAQTIQELFLPEVKLNGLIIRSDGSGEVWVNNAPSFSDNAISKELKINTRHLRNNQVRISLPDGGTVNLKPGQIYSLESQRIREAYEDYIPRVMTPMPEPVEEENTEPEKPVETAKDEGFDESVLAESESKIKLLEERIEKLEQETGDKN
jgi:hypothetical protein